MAVLTGAAAIIAPASPAQAAVTGDTTLLSVTSAGATVTFGGIDPAVSDDGAVVAFESFASTYVPGDTNGQRDVFVRDREAGTTQAASVSSGEVLGNGSSIGASVSDDGTKVVFESSSSNLVRGDRNGVVDVFLRDLVAGTTVRVSLTDADAAANGASSDAMISGDGTKVVFASGATNLVTGDTNGKRDVFVRDLVAGTTTRVSRSGATQGNGASTAPSIADDGGVVAFETLASNLVSGDTNGQSDVMVWTGGAGVTRISHPGNIGQANGASTRPAVRGDGLVVAFESAASNLVSGDTNGRIDVFLLTLAAPLPSRASVSSSGGQGNGDSTRASLSDDGLLVAFATDATNFVSGDTNGQTDVVVRDFAALTTSIVSASSARTRANGASTSPALAGAAPLVVYHSSASNLVPADTNALPDVYSSTALRCDGRAVTVDLGAAQTPTAAVDVVRGTANADVVDLGAGADRACLGAGDDQVHGGTDGDRVFGSVGLDTLVGDAGKDALFGEAQADTLDGGADADSCDGGGDADTAVNCETTSGVP